MTVLYSCRHAGDQFRITKFDNDMNVEASYLCTVSECECPAGVRDTCRHRQMLHKFLARNAINTDWMLDYDRSGWVQTDLGEALSGSVDEDAALATAGTATGSVDTAGIGENWREIMRAATIETSDVPAPAKPFRRGL